MIRPFTRFMVVVVILTLASGDAMASGAAAVLHGSGGVSVNGGAVTPTTTVFDGDRIDTAPNSAANLTRNGSSVLVDQNSSLIYGQSVNFTSGGATVKTEQAMGAKFQRVTITPDQSAARYLLKQNGNILTVAAIEGNLSIANGLGHFALVAGKSVDINLDSKVRETKAAMDEPSSTSTTTTQGTDGIGSVGNATGTYIAGGAAAVTAVAIIGLIAVNNKPVSPAGP